MFRVAGEGYQDLTTKEFITPGSRRWDEVQDWITDGNTPEPEFTVDQLREQRKVEVAEEGRRRIDAYGPSDSRAQRRALARAVKLTRKQAKGTLTPEESTELDALEAIGDNIEATEQLIESVVDYLDGVSDRAALEAYDPVNDPGWTI